MQRRDFFRTSSMIALGSMVPEFLTRTALAAEPNKDKILVVLEMTGGNDGLNTVIPYTDPLYAKNRPTIGVKKTEVVKINDSVGLHPSLKPLADMLQNRKLAVIQGVGYPNPDRSHFESMDVWHSADPKRAVKTGWIGRTVGQLPNKEAAFHALQVGPGKAPLILQGASGGVISLGDPSSFNLQLTASADRVKTRTKLLEDLNENPGADTELSAFIQRRQKQTLMAVQKIREAMLPEPNDRGKPYRGNNIAAMPLNEKLEIVAKLIRSGLGARVYYVSVEGFDTHIAQPGSHPNLLNSIGFSVSSFFGELEQNGNAERVLLMTYSEFGRRVKENASAGTDHGAASCMFLAGPSVKPGVIGTHPRLDDLDDGDLKFKIDFRRVYATLLDQWLQCDSKTVLNGKFEHLELLAKVEAPKK